MSLAGRRPINGSDRPVALQLAEYFTRAIPSFSTVDALGRCLKQLADARLDVLPLPGSGRTLERWKALAKVAGNDLGLCKLYEGHTDALAILAELGSSAPVGSTWGTWAAEPPQAKVHCTRLPDGRVRLDGLKAWCSGAGVLSHGLLTAWDSEGRQQLVAIEMHQPGVEVVQQGWHAVGMQATQSVQVRFQQAVGQAVGDPGGYLQRAGFWQGGIGIAACWFGAASHLAETLRSHCAHRQEPHALAHLGAVDTALYSALAVLRGSAEAVDAAPLANAELLARRARACVEACVETVIRHVGRALGAGPYCTDAHFARLVADLPVFMRQSHAERDLAALGQSVANEPAGSWQL